MVGIGICLERDFNLILAPPQRAHTVNYLFNILWGYQRGGTTAKKNTLNLFICRQIMIKAQIIKICINHLILINVLIHLTKKIAIRAFAQTIGPMHINCDFFWLLTWCFFQRFARHLENKLRQISGLGIFGEFFFHHFRCDNNFFTTSV